MITPRPLRAYLASPLGFSEAGRLFMEQRHLPALRELGLEPLDPWQLTPAAEVAAAQALPAGAERNRALRELNHRIGERNALAIEECDLLIACLDGQEVDSGTAAEIGYAAGLGRKILGWRSDFRQSGEEGSRVNLQVEWFIRASGGEIVDSLEALLDVVRGFHPDGAESPR